MQKPYNWTSLNIDPDLLFFIVFDTFKLNYNKFRARLSMEHTMKADLAKARINLISDKARISHYYKSAWGTAFKSDGGNNSRFTSDKSTSAFELSLSKSSIG